ncbi:MAG: hypothetical protein K0Q74_1513, partial [Gammaproteobacteria bacterium]|nr:hypothetical protein [Gammaproteobacteria bacterium]
MHRSGYTLSIVVSATSIESLIVINVIGVSPSGKARGFDLRIPR